MPVILLYHMIEQSSDSAAAQFLNHRAVKRDSELKRGMLYFIYNYMYIVRSLVINKL